MSGFRKNYPDLESYIQSPLTEDERRILREERDRLVQWRKEKTRKVKRIANIGFWLGVVMAIAWFSGVYVYGEPVIAGTGYGELGLIPVIFALAGKATMLDSEYWDEVPDRIGRIKITVNGEAVLDSSAGLDELKMGLRFMMVDSIHEDLEAGRLIKAIHKKGDTPMAFEWTIIQSAFRKDLNPAFEKLKEEYIQNDKLHEGACL